MKYFLLCVFILVGIKGVAQVGIGTTNPDNSALLELESSNSGLLLPRINLLSETDVTTIPNPAEGLMVYNLNANCNLIGGLYIYNGSRWKHVNYTSTQSITRLIRDEIGVANVTFSNINTTNTFGAFDSLFDNIDNIDTDSFHINRTAATVGDWGFGIALPKAYFISQLILDGRNDCCTNRVVNILVRLYRCGSLIYSSPALTTSVAGDNTIGIPNVYADEIRLVVASGGNVGDGTGIINFSELDVLATD